MKLLPATKARPTRRAIQGALLTVVAALIAVLAPTSAWASNAGDPQTTGCSNTATTLLSTNMYDGGTYMGTEYLRYSTGCQTEWVTVYYYNGYSAQPSVWMQNQSGTNLYAAENGGGATWTYQLGNMKYATACGGSQMYNSSGNWVGWYYIGCA